MNDVTRGITGMPEVSIILPTYNRASILPRAVESVLWQDYRDFELIIVDDASSDETEEVIKAFEDERIVYVRNSENSGAAAARNKGISLARGTLVAFQDSDDVWLPGKLRRQVEALSDAPGYYGACFSSYLSIGPKGVRLVPRKDVSCRGDDLYRQLLRANMVGTPTLVVRRDCLARVGFFDTTLSRLQDWDLALRISREYPMLFCGEPMLLSFRTPSSISEDVDAYVEAVGLLLSKYARDYRENWWLVINHYLFNAKLLARSGKSLQAIQFGLKALKVLGDRIRSREIRI